MSKDSKGIKQLKFRLPVTLHEKVKTAAKEQGKYNWMIVQEAIELYFNQAELRAMLVKVIIEAITNTIQEQTPERKIDILGEKVEAMISFVQKETMGVEQLGEITTLRAMINLLWIIGNSLDLPGGGTNDVALARLIESRRVRLTSHGGFVLTSPQDLS